MSQLINDTIEAYNLFIEGELSIEDLEYGIEAGLISESLLLELDATMLSESGEKWRPATHKEAADFHGDMANHHFNEWQEAKAMGDHIEAIQHYKKMQNHLKMQSERADAHFKETGKDYWSDHLANKKAAKVSAAAETKSQGATETKSTIAGGEHGGVLDHIHDHAAHYGMAAAGLAAAGAGAYALHKYLKNRKAKKNAEALKQAVNNIKAKKD